MKKIDFKAIAGRAVGVSVAGAAGAGFNKLAPNMNPFLRGGIKVGVGVLASAFIKPNNKPATQAMIAAADGLAGAGAQDIFNKLFNAGTGVQGIGDPEYTVDGPEYQVEGPEDVAGLNDALEGANNALGDVEAF